MLALLSACAEPGADTTSVLDAADAKRRAASSSVASWPADRKATQIGGGLSATYEPSGALWHDVRGTLLVVSDSGFLTEMDADGSSPTTWAVGGDDEAIAVADPGTSLVYVGVERPDSIVEFDLDAGAPTGRSWDLTATMRSADENLGLESLAFVPNGDHPYADGASGGLFYAGLQETGAIYVFDVDLSTSDVVTPVDTIATGRTDLSDLSWDPETGRLYALFDTDNVLREMTPAGATIAEYSVPGTEQEGVALRAGCPASTTTIFVAEDNGPSVKAYGRYPITCR